MSIKLTFLSRYWSLLAAFLILALEACIGSIDLEPVAFQNPARVVWIMCFIVTNVTVLCFGLIVHSWQLQRRLARNKWRLVLWTHALLFFALTAIVLGLGEIQRSTYDLSIEREQFQDLHWYAGDVKDYLIWIVLLDLVLIGVWAIIASFKKKPTGPGALTI